MRRLAALLSTLLIITNYQGPACAQCNNCVPAGQVYYNQQVAVQQQQQPRYPTNGCCSQVVQQQQPAVYRNPTQQQQQLYVWYGSQQPQQQLLQQQMQQQQQQQFMQPRPGQPGQPLQALPGYYPNRDQPAGVGQNTFGTTTSTPFYAGLFPPTPPSTTPFPYSTTPPPYQTVPQPPGTVQSATPSSVVSRPPQLPPAGSSTPSLPPPVMSSNPTPPPPLLSSPSGTPPPYLTAGGYIVTNPSQQQLAAGARAPQEPPANPPTQQIVMHSSFNGPAVPPANGQAAPFRDTNAQLLPSTAYPVIAPSPQLDEPSQFAGPVQGGPARNPISPLDGGYQVRPSTASQLAPSQSTFPPYQPQANQPTSSPLSGMPLANGPYSPGVAGNIPPMDNANQPVNTIVYSQSLTAPLFAGLRGGAQQNSNPFATGSVYSGGPPAFLDAQRPPPQFEQAQLPQNGPEGFSPTSQTSNSQPVLLGRQGNMQPGQPGTQGILPGQPGAAVTDSVGNVRNPNQQTYNPISDNFIYSTQSPMPSSPSSDFGGLENEFANPTQTSGNQPNGPNDFAYSTQSPYTESRGQGLPAAGFGLPIYTRSSPPPNTSQGPTTQTTFTDSGPAVQRPNQLEPLPQFGGQQQLPPGLVYDPSNGGPGSTFPSTIAYPASSPPPSPSSQNQALESSTPSSPFYPSTSPSSLSIPAPSTQSPSMSFVSSSTISAPMSPVSPSSSTSAPSPSPLPSSSPSAPQGDFAYSTQSPYGDNSQIFPPGTTPPPGYGSQYPVTGTPVPGGNIAVSSMPTTTQPSQLTFQGAFDPLATQFTGSSSTLPPQISSSTPPQYFPTTSGPPPSSSPFSVSPSTPFGSSSGTFGPDSTLPFMSTSRPPPPVGSQIANPTLFDTTGTNMNTMYGRYSTPRFARISAAEIQRDAALGTTLMNGGSGSLTTMLVLLLSLSLWF